MESPLWILNSTLVLIIVGIGTMLLLTRPYYPPRKSLNLSYATNQPESTIPTFDIARIAEKDPFGTYGAAAEQEIAPEQPVLTAPPTPPVAKRVSLPPQIAPAFLPPLPVVLKGIMSSPRENYNRAIIADKKTKQEQLYKTGDTILDAEIIRIESTKVMLLRSNGQQETLFISLSDAQADPIYQEAEGKRSAAPAIRKLGEFEYTVDPELFTTYVTNLAQFVDALDLTTYIVQGKAVGCRVGMLSPNSVGALLGFAQNDIVTAVNAIPVATTQQRLQIYQQISNMTPQDTIHVSLQRNQKELTLHYKIVSFAPKKSVAPQPLSSTTRTTSPVKEYKPSASRQAQSEPASMTWHDQEASRKAMMENGGKSALLRPFKS